VREFAVKKMTDEDKPRSEAIRSALPDRGWLRRIPKIDLHVHLDGSLRPRLIWDILERNGGNPFSSLLELEKRLRVSDEVADLAGYLRIFDFVLAYLQQPDDIERAAFELAEDSSAEKIRYLEVRFSPILHLQAAPVAEIVAGALRGLKKAEETFPIRAALILSCIREKNPESSLEVVRSALHFREEGVVGIDLAGNETEFPGYPHRAAFDRAAEQGLNITIHAGEARGAASIREALEILHARRVGHGLSLTDDPALLERFVKESIPLEVCLTTNVHTKSVKSFSEHPLKFFLAGGLKVTLNTDDRLMSGITLTDEFFRAQSYLGLGKNDIGLMLRNAAEAAFLPEDEKRLFQADFLEELDPYLPIPEGTDGDRR